MSSSRQYPPIVHLIVVVVLCFCVCGFFVSSTGAVEPESKKRKKAKIAAMFSPDGGCSDRIVQEIGRAKETVRVQMYMFTSKPIAQAIIDAQKRGVDCVVIADKSQEKMTYGRLPVLRRGGVKVLIDDKHRTANNKILLIDDRTIITGSFNYTKAAEEQNAENILIIKNHKKLFAKYLANFEAHREHSRAYKRD